MENNRGIILIVMIALVITMILMFFTQLRTQDDLNNTQTTLTAQFNGMNATATQNAVEVAAFQTQSAQEVQNLQNQMQTAVVDVEATTRADAILEANATATIEARIAQTAQANAVATERAEGVNARATTIVMMSTAQANAASEARIEGMDIVGGTLMPVIGTLEGQLQGLSATLTALPTLQAITPAASVNTGNLIYSETFDIATNWTSEGASVENGQLVIRTAFEGGTAWVSNGLVLATGYLEVHINTSNCPPTTLSGLVYGETYLFLVSCDGQSWIVAKLLDEGYEVLDFGLLSSRDIQTLGMMAQEDTLTLYFNGEQISGLMLDTLEDAAVGFYMIAEHEAVVYFDDLRVWQ